MNRSLGEKIFGIFNYTIITLMCIIMLYPYLNQLAISLNDAKDTVMGGISIFPRKFTLANFSSMLQTNYIATGFRNSFLRLFIGTAFSLTVTTFAAYVVIKKQLPGRKGILTFLLIPTFIHGGLIPNFVLFRILHIHNNFWVYILPFAFNFFNMLIIREYLKTIPDSLEESALLDGATEPYILFKIYLPISKPVLATIALWVGVFHWGDWTTSLYYADTPPLYTLQYILMKIIREAETILKMQSELDRPQSDIAQYVPTPQSLQAALLIIVTFPIICMYPFLQKYFVAGITLGSVKE